MGKIDYQRVKQRRGKIQGREREVEAGGQTRQNIQVNSVKEGKMIANPTECRAKEGNPRSIIPCVWLGRNHVG